MATFNKFNDFVEQIGLGKHNLSSDNIKIFLTNEAPLTGDTVKGDMVEITAGNGYTAGGSAVTHSWTESPDATGSLSGTDVVWTATGGSFGPFRYVVMYNATQTSPASALIGWWDYGAQVTCNDGETFTVDFGATILTLA